MKVKNFDLRQTLECGQCFNFEKLSDQEYAVVAFDRLLHVRQMGDELIFLNAGEEDINNIWIPYFDLNRDYGEIKDAVCKADERLKPITEQYGGIRILNQDFTETLISFIISQNKNITHIKQIVRLISENKGRPLGIIGGREYYSFPKLSRLNEITEGDFRSLKTGFRAPYLRDAIDRMVSGEIDGDVLRDKSFEEAKQDLTKIKGVGDKVANCVLLFSLGFRGAFPVDVWIKRIMEELYFHKDTPKETIEKFAAEKFGQYGGYAQQYLFIYAREKA
ncbi:MAG: DNA-3-methyladenine glycosylase 2 family protein [Lachnospiraceae bacterium]|nr:DNA-3-methyladenine glycosylase 2 family protein [Lachnospiraceae bacterium]